MTIQLAAEDGDFYGLPRDSVSAPNAGGKCVTAGETAPIYIGIGKNNEPNKSN